MSPKKLISQYDLTIIIPAYHEGKRIGKTLDELAIFLKKDIDIKPLRVEVLVVSADSPDETHAIVSTKANKFESLRLLKPGPKVGKGRDVKFGMLKAKGATVIFMDADLATPLRHLPKFYKTQKQGSDVVIATRNLLKHHPNIIRRLVSNGGNILFRFAGGVWVEDSQCGFKMFSQDASRLCFSKLTILGWGFDMEILAIAKANKMKIECFRIDDWVSVPESTFTEGLIKNSVVTLNELAHISLKRIRGDYTK